MLFFVPIADVLSDREELGMAEAILIGRIGPIGDGVPFACDVRGVRRLTGRLSHALGIGVVSAVDVATETGVLESVLSFGRMDVGLGRPVETDGLSFDNFGVSRWTRADLIVGIEFERSQFTTF